MKRFGPVRMAGVAWAALVCAAALGWAGEAADGPTAAPKPDKDGWYSLFDGKSLQGWKVSENPASVQVKDGMMVMDGPLAQAFYVGPVGRADFKDFEFEAQVRTEPAANSGVYFHTEFQEKGYPAKGHEFQINNTHPDPRKTGSLYAVKDVAESPVKDGEWFTVSITVKGRHITLKVNGQVTVDYEEPEGYKHPQRPKRGLSSGTFALQCHDPKSKVQFRQIRVRLPAAE